MTFLKQRGSLEGFQWKWCISSAGSSSHVSRYNAKELFFLSASLKRQWPTPCGRVGDFPWQKTNSACRCSSRSIQTYACPWQPLSLPLSLPLLLPPGSQKQRVCGCESHRRFTGELIYRCKHMSGLHTVLCTFPTRYRRCIIYTHTHMYLHATLNARLWAAGCATTMCFSSGKNHIYNHIFCCITISNCDSVIEACLHGLHTP